ncbi:MAG: hypothetical protein COT17_01860 [Elusimicrobia bacterium CG08_land_8_20_14_0_20_51_18]|nr:MAG: hypothetical protein COT17_01860 [Elusimicrobia bacterium CG08_land_8_20_14_0_20_51_18]
MNKTVFIFLSAVMNGANLYSSGFLELGDFIKKVERENPEINSAKRFYEAQTAKISQSSLPPDPSLEFEKMNVGGSEERSFYIKQELPNPLKLSSSRKTAGKNSDYYGFLYISVKNEILTKAKNAFYDYSLAAQHEKIYAEMLSLLDNISKISEANYATGGIKAPDALKINIEYSKMKNLLGIAKYRKEKTGELLNSFTGDEGAPPEPEVTEELSPASDFEELNSSLLKNNPEIRLEAANLEKSELELKSAGYSRYPDFMLGYRKRFYSEMNGTYDIVLGITLPLFFNKNKAFIDEVKSLKEAARERYNYSVFSNSYALKESFIDLKSAYESARLYKEIILPQSEESVENSLSYYQTGQAGVIDVLDSAKTYLDARLSYYERLADYHKSKAALKRATGDIYEE